MHRLSLLATALVVVVALSCSGSNESYAVVPADAVPAEGASSLPERAELFVDEALELVFVKITHDEDGTFSRVTDISDLADWSIADEAIATLDDTTALGVSPGETTVSAALDQYEEDVGESDTFILVVKERPTTEHDVSVTLAVPSALVVNQSATATVVVATTADAPGATVLATLDQHVRFVGAVPSAAGASCTVEDESVSCETGSLSAATPLEIELQIFVFEAGSATLDVSAAAAADPNAANDSASATLILGEAPEGDLGVSCALAAPPDIGLVGDAFRFRCDVENAGDEAVSGATVVLAFGDDFVIDEIEGGGGSCSESPTIAGEVRCVYDLDPLAATVLEIVATAEVAAPAPVNATVFGPIVDLNGGNDADVIEVPVHAVVSLAVTPQPVVIEVGQSLQLTGTATLDDDRTVDVTHSALFSWTVDDPSVAQLTNSVSSAGEVTGLLVGETDAFLTYYPTSLNVGFPVTVVAPDEGDTGTQCTELPAELPVSGDTTDTAVLCIAEDVCRITTDLGVSIPPAASECASEHRALVFGSPEAPLVTVGASFTLPWASGGVNGSGGQTTPALSEDESLYLQRVSDRARFVVDYALHADRLSVSRVEETTAPYPAYGEAFDCADTPRAMSTSFVLGQATVYARVCWDVTRQTCELHGDIDTTAEQEACALDSYAAAFLTTADDNIARAGHPSQNGWTVASSTAGTVDGNQRNVTGLPAGVDITTVLANDGLGVQLEVVYRFEGGGVLVQSARRL